MYQRVGGGAAVPKREDSGRPALASKGFLVRGLCRDIGLHRVMGGMDKKMEATI